MPNFRDHLATASYWIFVVVFGTLAVLFMIGPIVVGVIMSFTDSATLRFPPEGFSLRWYEALLDPVRSAPIHEAAWNSLSVAVYATLCATALGAPAAFGMARVSPRTAVGLEPVLLAPLVLPSLVFSLAALLTISRLGGGPSLAAVIIGHTVVFAPLLYRSALAVAQRMDPSLEDASTTLGAGSLRTFRRVTLPALLPGVFAGAFLVFMQSMDNVSVTLFLGDPGISVLPLRMFAMIEESLDGRVAAMSGLLILAAIITLLVLQRLMPLASKTR
jgi:putative spermidine/putrescine transport system permease protein